MNIALLSQGLLSMIVVIPVNPGILLIPVILVLSSSKSPVIPIILGIPVVLVILVIPPTLASRPSQQSHHCRVCYPDISFNPFILFIPVSVFIVIVPVISVIPFIPATPVIPVILVPLVIPAVPVIPVP